MGSFQVHPGDIDAQASALRAEAQAWVLRLHGNLHDAGARTEHTEWCSRSTEHALAYAQALYVWNLLGAFGATTVEAEARLWVRERPGRHSRAGAWALAAAVSAFAVALGTLAMPPHAVDNLFADAHTLAGEFEQVQLADGSRLTLDARSALDYRIESDSREIELLHGAAYFEVAYDSRRPLIVRAGPARITVTGTRFGVRHHAEGVDLVLESGSVTAEGGPGEPALHLVPGQSVRWSARESMQLVDADPSEALAWRRHRLVLRSQPLEQVMTELSRYRTGRVVVLGAEARSHVVTGVFDTRNPDRILDTITDTLELRELRLTPALTILY